MGIENELEYRVKEFQSQDKLLEAQRISERTNFDIEMLRETGFCSGIENYSRHLSGLKPGQPPHTLLDYFPDDFIIMVDESHITIPQIRGMYAGDRSRKNTLVEYGFRLPSALDNRPLNFDEFESHINQMLFVSATPNVYEKEHELARVEQIIRPTGLLDPEITVKPVEGQIDDLVGEIRKTLDAGNKVMINTLTKKMAEDLTNYLKEIGIRVRYLHSDIDTLERSEIIRGMRMDVFDVLVYGSGVLLVRGLNIPRDQSLLQYLMLLIKEELYGREISSYPDYQVGRQETLMVSVLVSARCDNGVELRNADRSDEPKKKDTGKV